MSLHYPEGEREGRRPEQGRPRERPGPDKNQGQRSARPIGVVHPVVVGYDGSGSARNALAYAAGMARRMTRPLLVVYVASPGVYCEPLTGQIVGLAPDAESLERRRLTAL